MKKIEPYKGIAVIYDEVRPSYPDKLIEDVICKTDLKINDRLLEIGPGTGKATVQFAEKGFNIHGVELGKDMAEVFRRKCAKYPKVSIEVASFDQWDAEEQEKFDMIYCAQAFHWLDVNIKYKKCYELLKDDGYLVLFWYKPSENESDSSKIINEKVEEVIRKYTVNLVLQSGKPGRLAHSGISEDEERKAEIEASGLFEIIEKIDYTEEIQNSAEQCVKARKSVPAFASILDSMDEETIDKMDSEIVDIINDHGGKVGTTFDFSLYIAKKI